MNNGEFITETAMLQELLEARRWLRKTLALNNVPGKRLEMEALVVESTTLINNQFAKMQTDSEANK